MEHCEICNQSAAPGRTGIVCSGTSCGGRIFHAKCVNLAGPVLEALTGGSNLGLFWFCERCRRHPERRVLGERNRHQELTAFRVSAVLLQIQFWWIFLKRFIVSLAIRLRCLVRGEKELPLLPAKIWQSVFRHLEEADLLRVRATCRSWQDMLEGCSALREKFLPQFPKGVLIDGNYTPQFLFPAASNIFFGNARIFEVGSWWARIGPGLTEINFCECKCVLGALLTMLRETPNLKETSWNDVMLDTVEGCSEVDFRLTLMEKFVFKGDRDAKVLSVMEKLCPNLKILLINSDDLSDDDMRRAVSFVTSVQKTLETLQITVTDSAMEQLLKLDQLSLKQLLLDGDEITDKSVAVDLCRQIPSIKGLHLQSGFSLRGSDLKELGESLPNLECFSTHFPHQMQILPTFLVHLPASLRHLALVGDNEERHTVEFTAANVGQGCPYLTHLALHEIILPGDSLQQLTAKSPQLTSLTLETVDIRDWPALYAAFAELPSLARVHLSLMNTQETVTEGGIVFNELPSVKFLKLNYCDFDEEELTALLGVLPNLEQLKLFNMYEKVGDGVLGMICRKFKRLSELKIVGCSLTPAQERLIYAELGGALRSLVISEDSHNCD
uniref:(northern house mosquito) hypothetical protein n=1 Tax=Culex pipiens TaxID=7175 RepID=A0A8D7ZXT5_CULPI